MRIHGDPKLPNGLELSCPAEAGNLPLIVAQASGPGTPPYPPARRVSFSELLGSRWSIDSSILDRVELLPAGGNADLVAK